jgi:hypothetical protein
MEGDGGVVEAQLRTQKVKMELVKLRLVESFQGVRSVGWTGLGSTAWPRSDIA